MIKIKMINISVNRNWVYFLFLPVIAFYYSGLGGAWQLDDIKIIGWMEYVNEKESLDAVDFWGDSFLFGRPISLLLFYIQHSFFNTDSLGFRLVSVIFHVLNAGLLYVLICNLGKEKIALPAALIWCYLPVHVSTALYFVQQSTIMATFFTTLAINFYVVFRQHLIKFRVVSARYFIALVCVSFLSLLNKEIGLLIPGYLLILEVCFFRWAGFGGVTGALKVTSIGYFVSIVAGLYLYSVRSWPSIEYFRLYDFYERLYTECSVVVDYLGHILVPMGQTIGLYQDGYAIQTSFLGAAVEFMILLAMLLFGLAGINKFKREFVTCSFGVLIFLWSQIIESTIVPLELYFEHRVYFGSFGIVLAIVSLGQRFGGFGKTLKAAVLAVAFIWCTASLVSLFARVDLWGDRKQSAAVAQVLYPESYRARIDGISILLEENEYVEVLDRIRSMALSGNFEHYDLQLRIMAVYTSCVSGVEAVLPPIPDDFSFIVYDPISISTALTNLKKVRSNSYCSLGAINEIYDQVWLFRNSVIGKVPPDISWSLDYYLLDYYWEEGLHENRVKAIAAQNIEINNQDFLGLMRERENSEK